MSSLSNSTLQSMQYRSSGQCWSDWRSLSSVAADLHMSAMWEILSGLMPNRDPTPPCRPPHKYLLATAASYNICLIGIPESTITLWLPLFSSCIAARLFDFSHIRHIMSTINQPPCISQGPAISIQSGRRTDPFLTPNYHQHQKSSARHDNSRP
jgi:hypothetical protein